MYKFLITFIHRTTLLKELKTTKNMLMSSLRNIEEIERDSQKVSDNQSEHLKASIEKLELFLISPDEYVSMSPPVDGGIVMTLTNIS